MDLFLTMQQVETRKYKVYGTLLLYIVLKQNP